MALKTNMKARNLAGISTTSGADKTNPRTWQRTLSDHKLIEFCIMAVRTTPTRHNNYRRQITHIEQ